MKAFNVDDFPDWAKIRTGLEDVSEFSGKEMAKHHLNFAETHLEFILKHKRMKEELKADFERVLDMYPFWTALWQDFAELELKLGGPLAKLEVYQKATSASPYSLELWLGYGQLLVEKNTKSEEVKRILAKGGDLVGSHFLSHDYWDLYLSYLESIDGTKNTNDYINVLLKIIRLPLYQYSRYYESFLELATNFAVEDLIPGIEIGDGKNEIEVINSHFNENFTKIQNLSNERWKYESKLEQVDFTLDLISQDDLSPWIKYLDWAMEKDKSNCVALFERALIPACFVQDIWMKYLRFMIHEEMPENQIVKTFNRACDKFTPLDLLDLRYMFVKYLQLVRKDDMKAKEVLLSIITQNDTNCGPVAVFIDFLLSKASSKDLLITDLETMIEISENGKKKIEGSTKKRKLQTAEPTLEHVKNSDLKLLYPLLTYRTVGQLIVSIVRFYWSDPKNARSTLSHYFKYEIVKCNKAYWFTYFKLEYMERDLKNLTNIVNYIVLQSHLTPNDINILLLQYKELAFKNNQNLPQSKNEMIRIFLETDVESSTHERHYLKKCSSLGDIEFNKMLFKQNGHPGATCDGIPITTNPISITQPLKNKKNRIEVLHGLDEKGNVLKGFTYAPNSLPVFRNVEKANNVLKYDRDFEKSM